MVGTRGFVLSSHSVRCRDADSRRYRSGPSFQIPKTCHWHVSPNYLYCIWHSTNTNLVGTRGFEPPTPSTPYWCASQTAPRPVFFYFKIIQMISKAINLINIFNLRFKLSFHKFIYRG